MTWVERIWTWLSPRHCVLCGQNLAGRIHSAANEYTQPKTRCPTCRHDPAAGQQARTTKEQLRSPKAPPCQSLPIVTEEARKVQATR